MPRNAPSQSALRVAGLSQSSDNTFALRPAPEELTALAESLGLSALRKLSFEGHVVPQGSRDWRLEGRLGATVVQPCVVTLEPVTTRIDTDVTRQYLRDFEEPQEEEAEMPEDDTQEALGAWIDPRQVMLEALALSVPDYPRKEGAQAGEVVHTEPGQKPMTDAEAKPFAGLAALRDALDKGED
jgi:uncharacterized metal-binding protein YceD (DUF177 family)